MLLDIFEYLNLSKFTKICSFITFIYITYEFSDINDFDIKFNILHNLLRSKKDLKNN